MKNILIIIAILGLIIFAVSCGDDSDDNNDDVLCPLVTGNYWVYEQKEYADFGDTVLVTSIDTITISVGADTVVNGFDVHKYFRSDYDTVTYFYANLDDGLYEIARLYSTNDTFFVWSAPFLLFKFPGNVGELFGSYGNETEIRSTDTTISVPAGDFECYSYMTAEYPYTFFYNFCPNIGYISTIKKEGSSIMMDRVLIDYYLVSEQ